MQNSITQLHNVTPDHLTGMFDNFKTQIINEVKSQFIPQPPNELYSRFETADYFKVNVSTIHNWTKNGTLQSYSVGNRIYYKRSELENVLIKLNK